jgi:hypothetical protein
MPNNIKTALIASTAVLLSTVAHGAVVTSWSFNAATTIADIGTGEGNAVETTLRAANVSKVKKSSNARTQVLNRALEVMNFDSVATRSGHDGLQFDADTTDFDGISVSFLQQNGVRSSAWAQFQYSIDGGVTFITNGLDNDGAYRVTATKNFQRFSFDLSGITGVDNNADFQFRVMAIHAPDADKFVATSGKRYTATGKTATWKFDDLIVTGATSEPASAIPAPGAIALLMAAGSIATGARRRQN